MLAHEVGPVAIVTVGHLTNIRQPLDALLRTVSLLSVWLCCMRG